MNISRREFLSGAAALWMGGWRLFAAPPGWKHGGTPNLVFGVVSDTHLRTCYGPSGKPGKNWPDKYFAAALEYFKQQNVDAVVHCGDMAHRAFLRTPLGRGLYGTGEADKLVCGDLRTRQWREAFLLPPAPTSSTDVRLLRCARLSVPMSTQCRSLGTTT